MKLIINIKNILKNKMSKHKINVLAREFPGTLCFMLLRNTKGALIDFVT